MELAVGAVPPGAVEHRYGLQDGARRGCSTAWCRWGALSTDTVFRMELAAVTKMAGRLFANYWAKVSPYYTKAYQEMWVGMGIMGYLYYKLSYGGKKAVDKKPAH
uniref:6.8 kDa mitochondrial proteolipid n=1 Tax=Knipowitschia caucasica TaxID=637954 RepID=A0AAV2KAN4_KNICA